ncbi:uncharacterized protein LOC132558383 [Ylistrum balloti]|uniref:uncharacterized protein LOC132558383 n=1 Tax=Ylistrum balloti TaxID=509963 RepID=UPI0029059800|nr:uncharacterized protein LOC132558383 [Ylistrum balloti]
MKSLGPWLLLLVVLVVLATEADAGRNKSTRKTRVKIKVKYTSKQKTRRGRSIEDTLTLPCDISEFDSDQDGSISETEWQNHFSEFNPILNSSEYVDYIIQQIDANGDGILQVSEFTTNTVYKKDC